MWGPGKEEGRAAGQAPHLVGLAFLGVPSKAEGSRGRASHAGVHSAPGRAKQAWGEGRFWSLWKPDSGSWEAARGTSSPARADGGLRTSLVAPPGLEQTGWAVQLPFSC